MIELVDRFQINGKLVNPVFIRTQNLVTIAVEGSKLSDIFPYFFIGSMKDMRSVLMKFYASGFICFRIAVASNMGPPLDYKDGLTGVTGDPFCEDRPQKSTSDYHKGVILNISYTVG